jgi:hypothetical protein
MSKLAYYTLPLTIFIELVPYLLLMIHLSLGSNRCHYFVAMADLGLNSFEKHRLTTVGSTFIFSKLELCLSKLASFILKNERLNLPCNTAS